MDDKEKQPTDPKQGEENDEEYEEAEEDYEEDGDADIGEELTDEKLRELGIDPSTLNDPFGEGNQGPADDRSWISTDEVGDIQGDISDEEADTSVMSFSDKIKKVFLDHTDAVMSLAVLNGNAFTGGMDDRLVKWDLGNPEKPIDSKKVTQNLLVH